MSFYLMCNNKKFKECMFDKWYFIEYDKDLYEYSLIKNYRGYNLMGFYKNKGSNTVSVTFIGDLFKKDDDWRSDKSFSFWYNHSEESLKQLYKELGIKDMTLEEFISHYSLDNIDLIQMDDLTYYYYQAIAKGCESEYWGKE